MPGNYLKESIQHLEESESLKSGMFSFSGSPPIAVRRWELQWTKFKPCLCRHKNKEYAILLFWNVICLKFLNQKSLLQLYLNCQIFVCFQTLPFHSKKETICYCHADWLALFCIEVCSFTEKDRLVGLTMIEIYSRHNCVPSKGNMF
jgi:hypothetical protein